MTAPSRRASRGSIRDALRTLETIGLLVTRHGIMATLNDLLVESRTLTLKQKGRPGRSLLGHEAVVAALRRRDAAANAMRKHIDQIADLLEHTTSPVSHGREPSTSA